MPSLRLVVISLRYSSWSMRPFLVLKHAGASFDLETATPDLTKQGAVAGDDVAMAKIASEELVARRELGSVNGLFPVLYVEETPIHESLAICEWVHEAFPEARLWPEPGIERARARAISCEMATGFSNMRTHMSCHLFGRVPSFTPNAATRRDIDRVLEIWRQALARSGGPFLFGRFSIADAMYFPVRTRLRSYGIPIPDDLEPYASALDALPAARALIEAARTAPSIAAYDDYLRSLGGDPYAELATDVPSAS